MPGEGAGTDRAPFLLCPPLWSPLWTATFVSWRKKLLSTPCLPTPSQSPPSAQHGSTRIKHNGYRLIADATAIGSGTTLPGLRLAGQVSASISD